MLEWPDNYPALTDRYRIFTRRQRLVLLRSLGQNDSPKNSLCYSNGRERLTLRYYKAGESRVHALYDSTRLMEEELLKGPAMSLPLQVLKRHCLSANCCCPGPYEDPGLGE